MENIVVNKNGKTVRIGGASGFWGDSSVAAPQLVAGGALDYLVFDYLAELTMAILAAAKAKKPEMGYATDFIDVAMKSVLPEIVRQGIKVISNAGGINPRGCADALAQLALQMGVTLKIAIVEGDDISAQIGILREGALVTDMFSGKPLPEHIQSANAYLGALPIARALAAGADVVITGRCVDSAVTLGALIHEFGWSANAYDLLAAGSLAGHVIECGCQATGGLHTDWESVPDWANIGYPIIECQDDGQFVVTKPPGTGGMVSEAVVAEQILYEIGDPGAYLLPDVSCDFRQVQVRQEGTDRVRVLGALGCAPSASYKVSATYLDGYRCQGMLVIVGIDAVRKARRTGEAIVERTRALFAQRGLPDYSAVSVEVIGAETLYGPHSRAGQAREVMMRVAVNHSLKEALQLFAREIAPAGTSWSPGTTGPSLARPPVSPLVKQFSFLLPKELVAIRVSLGEHTEMVAISPQDAGVITTAPMDTDVPAIVATPGEVWVPLIGLAYARSGDKGDISNIGVIARSPEYLPLILQQLTADAVKRYFEHLVNGRVERYLLPGLQACNFVLHEALDGGGTASMRMDPLGKGMAQILLSIPISVSAELARRLAA
jgi:hypothetical protein